MKKFDPVQQTAFFKACSKKTCRIRKFTNLLLLVSIFNMFGGKLYSLNTRINPETYASAIAQQLIIKGTVSDENGRPLPGVNIKVEGTTIGVISDANGKYSINIPNGNVTLTYSFIGYLNQKVSAKGKTTIDITLVPSVSNLEEVVVIGYGTQKKANLTGSVSAIQTKDIVNIPYTNISQALAGRLPGVFSKQSGGTPGADIADIRIRGGSNALIVVDGIIGRDYNTLDPNDIESVTVLKDAAAAAVYGARASSGVILVTTKRGTRGENMQVTYSGSIGVQNPINLPAKPTLREQMYYHRLAATNEELGDPYPTYTEDVLKKFEDGSDYDHYAMVDWYKCITKNAPLTQQNFSLSGGHENMTYFTSIGYENQDGLYEVSKYNRYNVRTNIDQYIPKINLHIGIDLDLRRNTTLNPSGSNEQIWWYISQLNHEPFPAITTDGRYINTWGLNPFLETTFERGYRKNVEDRIATKVTIDWDVPHVNGLNLKVLGSYDYIPSFYKSWSKWPRMYMSADDKVGYITAPPSLTESYSRSLMYTLESQISYKRSFGNHNVNGLFVYSQSESTYDYFSAQKGIFTTTNIDQFFIGSNENQVIDGYGQEYGRLGFVGRLQYNYKEKYLIEGNFRYDASQNFPKGQRWGLFPSVSIGWRISEESFFKNVISQNLVNNLKLRLSYGKTGNDMNAGSYPFLSLYALSGVHLFNGVQQPDVTEVNLASKSITWETQTSYNAGIDLGMFLNKLNFEFDTYFYRTTGILLAVTNESPTLLGIAFPKSNLGITRRGGYELNVNYTNKIFHDFTLRIGANMSYFVSFWENYNESPETLKDPYRRITYSDPHAGNLYTAVGLYQYVQDIYNSPLLSTTSVLRPGDIQYKDINGDGIINSDDEILQGKGNYPQYSFGFSINADYKGFNLDAFFQGAAGMDQSFGTFGWGILDYTLGYPNYRETLGDYWTPQHRNAKLPKIGDERNNYAASTYWSMDNSYVRLKSLKLSYDFKHSLIKNDRIGSFNIFLSGTNVFTLQKLYKIFDPENTEKMYPVMKVYSIGVNLTVKN
jgi:TonB-linked SusC/RagA family outer membrane protein